MSGGQKRALRLFDFKLVTSTFLLKKTKAFYLSRLIFGGHFLLAGKCFLCIFCGNRGVRPFRPNFVEVLFPEFLSYGSQILDSASLYTCYHMF